MNRRLDDLSNEPFPVATPAQPVLPREKPTVRTDGDSVLRSSSATTVNPQHGDALDGAAQRTDDGDEPRSV